MVTVGLVWVNFCPALWVNYTPAVTLRNVPIGRSGLASCKSCGFSAKLRRVSLRGLLKHALFIHEALRDWVIGFFFKPDRIMRSFFVVIFYLKLDIKKE
jgi:hypothetical protein